MNSVAIDNKQMIQEYFLALSGKRKTESLLDRYISDSGLKEHIRAAEAAFPEYELKPIQLVAESDLVAARCTFRGVHKGEFAGIPPTGKTVSTDFMIFYRIKDGRITEHWMQMDTNELLSQLRS
ncbi:MAG TPA: ester cyclase [Terracidiphilus sp.]|nr:ester cyclase [Terracidiphilus sp.]